jgi:hypothetical protein
VAYQRTVMSATAAPQPRPPLDPVAFVAGLADRDKHALLLALLREAIDLNGETGPIPIDDGAGQMFGYYVPQKAAEAIYETHGPKLTEAEEEEIDRRLANPGPAVPIQEVIDDLKRELADLRQQRTAS